MAFIRGQFHERCLSYQSLKLGWKITYLKFRSNLPGANELIQMGLVMSLRLSDAIWCQTSWPTLVQVMACCLFNNKPLPKPVLIYLITNLSEIYRKISNIRCTKSPNLNVPRLVLQLSLPNSMKPGVKSRMKMLLEQRRQAMLHLHLSDRQFYCLLRCALY